MEPENRVCKSCNTVFRDKNALDRHRLTCLANKGANSLSYYKCVQTNSTKLTLTKSQYDSWQQVPKILPLTQSSQSISKEVGAPIDTQESQNSQNPLTDTQGPLIDILASQSISPRNPDTSTATCRYCQRVFTARGVKKHENSCKSKPVQSQSSPTTETTPNQESEVENIDSRTVWGNHTLADILMIGRAIYEEVVHWRKNLFKLPSGAAGKRYIKELTRLIDIWNADSHPLSNVSLKLSMIMPALLLQKPSKKSSSKLNTEYLNKRLNLWEEGNFDELMKEMRAIQLTHQRERPSTHDNPDNLAKSFAKLMMQGKVNAALRLLDRQETLGVAKMSEDVMTELRNLHPEAQPASADTLMSGDIPYFDPVRFTNIDDKAIATAALKTRGSAGPSGLDADGWRRMLVSKNFGKTGKDLRVSIAKMAQNLCSREVQEIVGTENSSIEAYTSNRLIPLLKSPSGIRPIGIGEVLRRIIGKAVVIELKPDLVDCGGSLQVCTGIKAGCEAAAHAINTVFAEEETDGVLLVDASNAFNSINRKALLHNIRYICPQLSTYIRNCYKFPARLFVSGEEVASAEGTTQGDPTAMDAYAIGIRPLLSLIVPNPDTVKQVAYADDLAGGAHIEELRNWWDRCEQFGPAIGYHPKAEKSWLVVKENELRKAEAIFEGTGVRITTVGRKYLGGFVGTEAGKIDYVDSLMKEWIYQLQELCKIAKSEPQAAYTAFTSGFKHKLTYFLRTIPDLQNILISLDEIIDNEFIPAITEGHHCSSDERVLLSLPVKMGGLGIPIFTELCDQEYASSRCSTEQLVDNLVHQRPEMIIDAQKQKESDAKIKKEKADRIKTTLDGLRTRMSKDKIRGNDLAQLKGASAWLNALPIAGEGYSLTKREFFDAIALRYRWDLKRLPFNCSCSKKASFEPDHAMNCLTGGFVHRRHDGVRDILAQTLNQVAYDVRIEPQLQPLTGEVIDQRGNLDDEARTDIAARGFWAKGEMAHFDVKVFNPYAKSYLGSSLDALFKQNESAKKREYGERIVRIEHGSFTPVVLSAYGGFGVETNRFLAHLINKIADKRDLERSYVANYIRTKISFHLVRSQVLCIRGARKLYTPTIDVDESEVAQETARIRQ